MNARFQALQLDAHMIPMEIPANALDDFWKMLRASKSFLGCSIIYPHKRAAFAAADRMTERAKRLGAINTIRGHPDGRLEGDSTDGLAALGALQRAGFEICGRKKPWSWRRDWPRTRYRE